MESLLGFLKDRDKLFPVSRVTGEDFLELFLYIGFGQYIFIFKSRDGRTFLYPDIIFDTATDDINDIKLKVMKSRFADRRQFFIMEQLYFTVFCL